LKRSLLKGRGGVRAVKKVKGDRSTKRERGPGLFVLGGMFGSGNVLGRREKKAFGKGERGKHVGGGGKKGVLEKKRGGEQREGKKTIMHRKKAYIHIGNRRGGQPAITFKKRGGVRRPLREGTPQNNKKEKKYQ